MATLQNLGVLKYRDKDGNWKPLPVVLQSSGGGGGGGTVVTIDTTLSKSGQAADAKAAGDAIEKKLDKAQGVENAGMILGVNEDGDVAPEDKPVQALAGATAPTTATVGVVGQEYYVIVDNAVTEMYVCTSALIGSYTWDKVEFGGGTSNAVQYTEQSLTDTQKQQARTNIGAGTSSFSGSYNDLTDTPIPDTTLKQSGKPADAKAVGEALDEVAGVVTTFDSIKVDKSQGTANAGKYLGVGNDGNVTVVDAPSSGGTDKSLGITSATVGQIAKITAVDSAGKPTAWEAVDMAEGEKWELINTLIVADGTEETNSLTFNADLDGNAFQLKKARLCCAFPPYVGSSTIPNFFFSMLNGHSSGEQAPLGYTQVFPKLSKTSAAGSVWTIDVSGPLMTETILRGTNWGDPTKINRNHYTYGSQGSTYTEYFANATFAYPITSIGGAGMLIYPGCRFELYGVRT